MKGQRILISVLALALLLTLAVGPGQAQGPDPQGTVSLAPLGTGFTYQGQLKQDGSPVNATCDFRFSLWDAASEGAQAGPVRTASNVTVTDGLFTVQLDFGSDVFTGDARWLQIAVRCPAGTGAYTTLSPRQALTPAPYALALPGLWTQQNATSPNLIGGYSGNRVTSGVVGATIGGGGRGAFTNRVTDDFGTVGGGEYNRAGNDDATTTNTPGATVGGGWRNTASNAFATVGGGYQNTASGSSATVSGGNGNTASDGFATVGGGTGNTASGTNATVSGGYGNTARGGAATVSGGYLNRTDAITATIGGGEYISVTGRAATVAGGSWITVTGSYATVGGGWHNSASGYGATVGGGGMPLFMPVGAEARGNTASGDLATVSGGSLNTASGDYATVSGGYINIASGNYATVPGGSGAAASRYGQMAYASGMFQTTGDAQTSVYVQRNTTTDATPKELFLDGLGQRLTLAPDRTMTFDILVVARSSGGASAGYHIRGAVENTGGFTDFVGTPTVTTLGEELPAWNVAVEADDANDALIIRVTGSAGLTIRWVATVRTAEVAW